MSRTPFIAAALMLAACSQQAFDGAAQNSAAAAQPTIAMACWLVEAADAGFASYAASAKADAAVVADERKAVAAAKAICADPPENANDTVSDVIAAYKAVVAATPSG
ncbi:MAG: hypothetical protein ACREFQ_23290 [Stellaceae bacterium]